jgi:uncharacterized SAM-binding protein YcdF (DUF218 family)
VLSNTGSLGEPCEAVSLCYPTQAPRTGEPLRVFYFLSKLLDVLLTPLLWSVVLVLVGIAGPSRRRRAWAGLGVAVLLGFSLEPVSNSLWRSLEYPEVRSFRPDVTYDVVILLGGVVEDRAQASSGQRSFNDNNERLLETFDLLRKDKAQYAIVSGGPVDPTRAKVVEAQALADQLISWGIDPTRVIVEDHAKNTYENAVDSAAIVRARRFHSVLVVTSAFHMKRALGCFRAVDLDVDTLPVDFRSYTGPYRGELIPRSRYLDESTVAIREWFGRAIYRARGYAK